MQGWYRARFLAAIALASVAGCGDDGGAGMPDSGGMNDGAMPGDTTWTVFVYGHADHNLTPSLAADMMEMAQASLGPHVNVVVMADWNAAMMPFPTGTEWYRIAGNGAEPELVKTEPEQNLDDPAVLTAAIEEAFTEYPADRHALILWDHGGSWQGGYGGDWQDGEPAAGGMSVTDLAFAVEDGLTRAGLTGERPIELLVFDTCLMGSVEVLADLASLSEVYIANAEIDYGNGWDYNATFSYLSANPDATVQQIAEQESMHWDAHHATATPEDTLLRSHVAIDTSLVEPFVASYRAFTDAWLASDGLADVDVGRSAYFALPGYYADSINSLAEEPNLRDVGQFLDAMSAAGDPDVAAAAGAARGALGAMTIAEVQGDLRAAAQQSGMHIELPPVAELATRLSEYQTTAQTWSEASGWGASLTFLQSIADGEAPVVTTAVAHAFDPGPGSLPTLTFGSDAADIAAADINVALVSPDAPDLVSVLGLVGTGSVDAGFDYEFVWDAALLTVSDGTAAPQFVAVFPYARLAEAEATILAIPGELSDGTMGVEAMLLFQSDDATADAAVVSNDDTVSLVQLSEVAGMGVSFIPIYPVLNTMTGEVTADRGDPIPIPTSGSLVLAAESAPAGDWLLLTVVSDVWGNAEPAFDLVEILTPVPVE